MFLPWLVLAQVVGALSHKQKVAGWIPSQGTCLSCRFGPQSGYKQSLVQAHMGGNLWMLLFHIDLSLSPPSSLSKSNGKMSSSENKKINE